jgi:hypothetical protein
MANLRSRIRHLRAPVVVTIALGAVAGCSGKTVGGNRGNPASCPSDVPAAGADCDHDGPACKYGDCYGDPTETATCESGAWAVSITTCNPPPPDVPPVKPPAQKPSPPDPDATCPLEVPQPGTPCSFGDGGGCRYGSGCSPQIATCWSRVWEVAPAPSDCNPPPPPVKVCPTDKPVSGGYCNYEGPACEYDDCGSLPSTRATCANWVWTVITATCNPPPPMCPSVAPGLGAPCDPGSLPCTYPTRCGSALSVACMNGVWQVAPAELPVPPPNWDAGGPFPGCEPRDAGPYPTDAPGDAGGG